MEINDEIIIKGTPYRLSDPSNIIKTFCITDSSYEKYDCEGINSESWIKDCIRLSNSGMRARIEEDLILNNKNKIELAAAKIPEDINLKQATDIILNNLKKLFECIETKGVRNARITKVLHKKFPLLIPIVDEIVGEVYFPKKDKSEGYKPDDINNLMEVIKLIKHDLNNANNIALIENIKIELKKCGINNLSDVRIFDMLLWTKGMEDKLGKSILFEGT